VGVVFPPPAELEYGCLPEYVNASCRCSISRSVSPVNDKVKDSETYERLTYFAFIFQNMFAGYYC